MRHYKAQFITCGLTALLLFSIAGCIEKPDTVTGPVEAPLFHSDDDDDGHSHGRFFHLTWTPVDGLDHTVRFTYKVAFRWNGLYPCRIFSGGTWGSTSCTGPFGRVAVGDVFVDNTGATGFQFGDGVSLSRVLFRATSVNASENWMFAEAVDHITGEDGMRHTYPGGGPYLARSITCCRIGGLNNSGQNYGVRTLVSPDDGNRSPVSNMVPIVNVSRGGTQTWTIPAGDQDGDPLRFSLPSPGSIGLDGAQPPDMSIDQTGQVSWNTDGKSLGLYWSAVMIEDLDSPAGDPKTFVVLDYLINLIEGTANNPPIFTQPSFCGSSTIVPAGEPGSFSVEASDPDGGDIVALAVAGVPSGATFVADSPDNPVAGLFNWTPTVAQEGPHIVSFSATDQHNAQAVCNVTIDVQVAATINEPPVADPGGPYAGLEGSIVHFDGTASFDPEGDDLVYSWDFGDGNSGNGPTPSHTYLDNGTYEVKLTVTDELESTGEATTIADIANVAPDVGMITGLPSDPIPVGSTVSLSTDFTDPGILDTHTAEIAWGDGQSSTGSVDQGAGGGSVEGSHTYLEAGVHAVTVTVTDNDGDSGHSTYEFVVVYDPDGGFVTGGGWTDVGAGSYTADLAASGPARFGFVSKYLRGRITPDGQTQFQFHAAGMNFHSGDYEWLVISGPRAQYKGTGTINQEAGYCFLMTAVDGQVNGGDGVDQLRLKIWDCDSESIVFDNHMGEADDVEPTAITRGSIVIHNK